MVLRRLAHGWSHALSPLLSLYQKVWPSTVTWRHGSLALGAGAGTGAGAGAGAVISAAVSPVAGWEFK